MKIELDASSLAPIITETISDTLRKELNQHKQASEKKYLSREEAKKLTGYTDRQLKYLRDNDRITYSQSGRTILYDKLSLEQHIQRHLNIVTGGKS